LSQAKLAAQAAQANLQALASAESTFSGWALTIHSL
jgi:hypothetical protein